MRTQSKENSQKTAHLFCSKKYCRRRWHVGQGNIVCAGQQNGKQVFKCTSCETRFVETKHTLFYRKKFPKDKVILLCKLLVHKNGVRPISRIMEISTATVEDYLLTIATHCRKVNDFLIKEVKLTQVELDEFWSFVKKRPKLANDNRMNLRELATTGAI